MFLKTKTELLDLQAQSAQEKSVCAVGARADFSCADAPLVSNEVCYSLDTPSVKDFRSLRYKRRSRAQALSRRNTAMVVEQLLGAGEVVAGENVRVHRSCWCGYSRLSHGGVDIRATMTDDRVHAHFTGVQYCGAVWRCPSCSAIIRQGRACEVEEAVRIWRERGGGAYLVTVTLRHHLGDDLRENLDALSDAWRKTVSGAPWGRIKEEYGLAGYIRSLEITYGASGWHPHYHFIFLTDELATKDKADKLKEKITPRWIAKVRLAGGKTPNKTHGVDVSPVGEEWEGAARYVGKIAEGIAQEVTRGDMKEGREASLVPFQLLDRNDSQSIALWHDYVRSTKSKRSVYFSRGLRKKLGMQQAKTDEELVEELESTGDIIAAVDTQTYNMVVRHKAEQLAMVLSFLEKGNPVRAAQVIGCEAEVVMRFDWKKGRQVECYYLKPPGDK